MIHDVKEWLGAVGAGLGLISLAYTWITARSRTNGELLGTHERKLMEHDRRIQKVESEVDHLPTKDDFNELSLKVERSNGLLRGMEAEYRGLNQAVLRIEKFLTAERKS